MPIAFSEEQYQLFDKKIRRLMNDEKPFLRLGYTIRQMATETGIPMHQLSAFINHYYKVNFNDFINEQRVSFCIRKMQNCEWKQKTLEALAQESGFNNRNSFTLAFKKFIGTTPSGFLKAYKPLQAAS